jgi:uncharacterized protein (TIGR03083 family)
MGDKAMKDTAMDDTRTWALIHAERASVADTLAELTPSQWAQPSICGDWTVQIAAAHIVMGAEQTKAKFFKRMAANGFRFNTMIDRDARSCGKSPSAEIVSRLRATVNATSGPPAPVMTMLGEVVVHGQDIFHPLGIKVTPSQEALAACMTMYTGANFPVGTKKRIAGLRLVANDGDWSHGDGPEVSGPGTSLLLAMTGRAAALTDLSGEGLATLRERMTPAGR